MRGEVTTSMPSVPFLYTVCCINHFLVMHTDNFLNLRYCEVLIKSKFYGLSDGGFGIWVRCWCGYLVRKRSNYQKKGPWILLPIKTSMITAMMPIMNTIQHKAYIALPIETIIEYKKSDIIVFQLELWPKVNKKIDMSSVFFV